MATVRDNYLQLNLTEIKIKSFEVKDHSITKGQPYKGVSVSGNDKLLIKAGRHGSEDCTGQLKPDTFLSEFS